MKWLKYWTLIGIHNVTGKRVIDFMGTTYVVYGRVVKNIGRFK